MRHGSLFSGIGGFDLAAEWMGWENVFHCEWNEFGQKILKHYWPKATSYADITKTDFTIHRGNIDILTGGFPCQPYSAAGKRLGKADDRHLWPEMLRAIREIQPRWVVGENVRGLTNWNGGMVFDEVQADLEAEGYEVLPFLLPACAVNAPHRRDRIWFVAYSDHPRANYTSGTDGNGQEKNQRWQKFTQPEFGADSGDASDTNSDRQVGGREQRISIIEKQYSVRNNKNATDNASEGLEGGEWSAVYSKYNRGANKEWDKDWVKVASEFCGVDDGISERLDGITFSKWRNESIKGYGNAIVPQVAYELFKVIEKMNQ